MRPYRLAPRVRACVSDDGAILLDIDRDAYVGLDPDQAAALSQMVEDFPASRDRAPASDDAAAFARALLERGLLIHTDACGSAEVRTAGSAPCVFSPAESELIPWNEMRRHRVRISHILQFLRATLTAIVLLRCRPFSYIVDRASQRKRRQASRPMDRDFACALLSAFFHIRPFIYAPKGRCLLDSIALLEFLAHYDVHPDWVVGVKVVPFASHSWLQHERFVLNGTPAYVRAYTPILVI
jgi:transglutaminase superfamily protein